MLWALLVSCKGLVMMQTLAVIWLAGARMSQDQVLANLARMWLWGGQADGPGAVWTDIS